jgi:hypothetical protein
MLARHPSPGRVLNSTVIALAWGLERWFPLGAVAPALEAHANSGDIYYYILTP